MIAEENSLPNKIAIDRPSFKLLKFMKKYFNLEEYVPQNNNFVIYDDFFNKNYQIPHQYQNKIETASNYQNDKNYSNRDRLDNKNDKNFDKKNIILDNNNNNDFIGNESNQYSYRTNKNRGNRENRTSNNMYSPERNIVNEIQIKRNQNKNYNDLSFNQTAYDGFRGYERKRFTSPKSNQRSEISEKEIRVARGRNEVGLEETPELRAIK